MYRHMLEGENTRCEAVYGPILRHLPYSKVKIKYIGGKLIIKRNICNNINKNKTMYRHMLVGENTRFAGVYGPILGPLASSNIKTK